MLVDTRRRIARLSPAGAVGICVIAAVVVAGAIRPLADPDTWWHLWTGRWIVERGRIPTVDLLTFTGHGEQYIPHSWLFEVVMALFEVPFGLAGLVVLRVLLLLAVYGSLAWVLLRRSTLANPLAPWTLVVLTVFASAASWSLRPYLASYLLLILTFVLLERHGRARWLLVPLLVLWVNLHGLWLVGIGLVGLKAVTASIEARSVRRDWLVIGGTCALATLVNPFGLRLHLQLVELSATMKAIDVMEWRATDFTRPTHWAWAVLVALIVLTLWRHRDEVALFDLLVTIVAIALGLFAVRNLPPSAIMLAIVGAPRFAAATRSRPPDHGSLPALAIAIALAVLLTTAILKVPASASPQALTEGTLPIASVQQLEPGNVFTLDAWGGIVSYLRWPEVLVAYDTRVDFHGADAFETYRDVIEGEAHKWLDENCVAQVLALEEWPLSGDLTTDPSWREVEREALASGETAVLFRRSLERCPPAP